MGAWRPGCNVYAHDGDALITDLEAWMGQWGSGRYEIQVRVRHPDGVSSLLEGEALVVRPITWAVGGPAGPARRRGR